MNASVLAVIFDFDDTLAPDSTTKLLRAHGVDAKKVWDSATELVAAGYDAVPAYLKLVFDLIGPGKPLGELTNAKLRAFGATLDGEFFPGIPQLFEDLKTEVARFKDISIEFYIVSSGLRALLEGSAIVNKYFEGVYACELGADTDDGVLKYIKRCVTFTEKTRYVYEINKGLDSEQTRSKPQLVNKAIPPKRRRVPFENMIYVGDGLTDVPCFSLVGHNGGMSFAVFDPDKKDKAKQAFSEFLKARKLPTHFPRYRADDELGSHLRTAVLTRCTEIKLAAQEADSGDEDE